MYTLNGVRNGVGKGAPVINGGKQARINANYPYDYDKWRMAWNGNHFAPPEPGSVLYLPGVPGQGSTIQDFSGNSNNGTIVGAVWGRLPSGLPYLDCDGLDDYIWVADSASLDITDNLTAEMWMRIDTLATSKAIIAKRSAEVSSFWVGQNSNTALEFYYNDAAGAQYFRSSAHGLTAGKWAHLAVVKALNANPLFYINGAVLTTVRISGTGNAAMVVNNNRLSIGAWDNAGTPNNFTDGAFALARVSNVVKTLAQVAACYQQERHLAGV